MGTEKQRGYHLCARHKHKLVTVHGPTDDRRHQPPAIAPRHASWVGPFGTEREAQDEAQAWAGRLDYDTQRCRQCFHTPEALDWRQKRARERRARTDWMPGVGRRPSRGGMRNARRK